MLFLGSALGKQAQEASAPNVQDHLRFTLIAGSHPTVQVHHRVDIVDLVAVQAHTSLGY
jgi:hypothetical protein